MRLFFWFYHLGDRSASSSGTLAPGFFTAFSGFPHSLQPAKRQKNPAPGTPDLPALEFQGWHGQNEWMAAGGQSHLRQNP